MLDKKTNTLDALLKDFARHDKKMKSAPKGEVNTKLSFQELAKLQKEALAKQSPVTLSQARAQVLNLKIRSDSKNEEQKAEEIKYHLRMYFPKISEKKINEGLAKLYEIYNDPD